MEHDFFSLSSGRLQGETGHIKESPNGNLCSISSIIQSHFWYQIQAFAAVFRNWWDWFLQMENAITGRNLQMLNFAYHLAKPWTDRFAHVNGKKPVLRNIVGVKRFLITFLKVTLHETIRNEFWLSKALQRYCDIVSNSFNIVPTLQRCVALIIKIVVPGPV